jgi:hypothetical protein
MDRVVISEELQQELEIYCTVTGQPVADVIEEVLRHWLATEGAKHLEDALAKASI